MSRLGVWAELVKLRVSAAAALSGLAVFSLAARGLDGRAWPLAAGLFLLACGACALNEVQERGSDALMLRTRGRPVPSGRLGPGAALAVSAALLAGGLLLILAAAGKAGALLALAAVAWYNGLYTPLKRATPFAVVPGALVGAVPAALGWLAAGRSWQDPRLPALCLFFYLWQVPHLWLMAPAQAEDLAAAGLPSAGAALGERGLGRVSAVWVCSAAASALLLPLFGATSSALTLACLAGAAAWLTWRAAALLVPAPAARWRQSLRRLNAFAALVMALLAADPYL